jgi:TRAP-type C4-dicarboxylate transport system permease small subunit
MESNMKSKNLMQPIETGITSLNKWLSIVAAVFCALIMIIATIDVITAKVFSTSVPGAQGLIEEFNVVAVFLTIAYVAHERGHVRITLFERWMSDKLILAFKLLGYIIGTCICSFCCWRAWTLLLESIEQHTQKYGAIDFPVWPFQITVVLGFALLAITFLLLFVKEMLPRRDEPVPDHS